MRRNPATSEKDRSYNTQWARNKRAKKLPIMRSRGIGLNQKEELENGRKTIPFNGPVEFKKSIIVKVPFHSGISKNMTHGYSSRGYVYTKQEGMAIREAIHYKIKSLLSSSNWKFHTGKVWLDIFVEKPNHRSDAVNVLDTICDAVKTAIGVDDRWYAVRRIDWAIVKTDPIIQIVIGQENEEESEVCYFCGRVRPIKEFTKRKQICIECRKEPMNR